MTTALKKTERAVARPLKVLVPLIKEELEAGNRAGLEHYRRAGEMLIEAREQITYGNWGKWLSSNFKLSQATAYRYMDWARIAAQDFSRGRKVDEQPSLRAATGRNPDYAKWKPLHEAARKLDAELFSQERQTQDEEIQLRRALVAELFDIGYKALATRLHPDRGGSKDAMVRLNAIREQLTEIAKTRRWI